MLGRITVGFRPALPTAHHTDVRPWRAVSGSPMESQRGSVTAAPTANMVSIFQNREIHFNSEVCLCHIYTLLLSLPSSKDTEEAGRQAGRWLCEHRPLCFPEWTEEGDKRNEKPQWVSAQPQKVNIRIHAPLTQRKC